MSDDAFPNPAFITAPPSVNVVRAIGSQVEAAGGKLLPEPCRAEDIIFRVGGVRKAAQTCGCGNVTRMALPAPSPLEGGGEILATVCAVCDSVADMPRFGAGR